MQLCRGFNHAPRISEDGTSSHVVVANHLREFFFYGFQTSGVLCREGGRAANCCRINPWDTFTTRTPVCRKQAPPGSITASPQSELDGLFCVRPETLIAGLARLLLFAPQDVQQYNAHIKDVLIVLVRPRICCAGPWWR